MSSKSKFEGFVCLILVASCCLLSAADPTVSNVRASQRPGTQLVDITYDLLYPDSSSLTVSVAVFDNGGASYAVPVTAFSGALGAGITPGNGKKITWDAGADWPGKFSSNMQFRVTANDQVIPTAPTGMALIPAGSFTMGDTFNEGWGWELPTHTVYVSAFYMDKYEVTKALWDSVYVWGVAHGYSFDNPGLGKAANHPVYNINWYDMVKWCNARSEKEGRVPAYYTSATQTTVYRTGQVDVQNGWVKWNAGYRLPTEAEWEKAARGGASGHRFPWSNVDTITHSQANYYSYWSGGKPYPSYDLSPTEGYHPNYDNDPMPYTSPVGSFAPNGYGLYDMAGNVWEWCWDWYGSYSSAAQIDPRGPSGTSSGSNRVNRGGGWYDCAFICRVARRNYGWPGIVYDFMGFRSALPSGQP